MSSVKSLCSLFGLRVCQGPFRGMRYVSGAVGSRLGPKIIGTYEKELNSVVEALIMSQPSSVVDVGAAEGYYAIGFARRLPETHVTAFEATTEGRHLLTRMAALNGVNSRLTTHGLCTVDMMVSLLAGYLVNVLIMDVEGSEIDLLGERVVPLLSRTCILLELHGVNTGSIMRQRFMHTHNIQEINARTRRLSDVESLPIRMAVALLRTFGRDYMYERQSGQSWLYMTPRKHDAAKQGLTC